MKCDGILGSAHETKEGFSVIHIRKIPVLTPLALQGPLFLNGYFLE